MSGLSKSDSASEKEHRKRTKDIIKRIQKQLEFYFGDANLRHDRFLRREMTNNLDGYIEVDVIASFNKMKEICSERKLIIKAIKKLDILELDEAETHVKRVTPLPAQVSTDKQTVYVEYLPSFANHDWLMEIFGTCGKVDYVSLPRYKSTGLIKGFAFIEFASESAADKACLELNTIGKRTKKPSEEAGESEDKKGDTACAQNGSERQCQDVAVECTDGGSAADASGKKRKAAAPEDQCDQPNATESKKRKKESGPSEEDVSTCEESGADVEEVNAKSERRKKRKRRQKSKEDKTTRSPPPLYVISKREWSKKKLLYKKLQRGEVSAAKSAIITSKQASQSTSSKEETVDQSRVESETATAADGKPMVVPFAKRTVLKVRTTKESMTKLQLKQLVCRVCPVAYADFNDNEKEGFLRFHDPDAAQTVLSHHQGDTTDSPWPFQLTPLTDDEEAAYHTKITADRQQRFKERKRQVRGIDKISRKLNQIKSADVGPRPLHMHFD